MNGITAFCRSVMRGLDPRIHEAVKRAEPYSLRAATFITDCQVKPGNDAER